MNLRVRCCNCSSVMDLTSTISSLNLPHPIEVKQALFSITGSGYNKIEFPDDIQERRYVCSICLPSFIELYSSKLTFLKKTSKNSCISKLTSSAERLTKEETIEESILPDWEINNEDCQNPSEIKSETPVNAVDFLELFASIEINRLSENQANEINDEWDLDYSQLMNSSDISINSKRCKKCHRRFRQPELMKKHCDSVHEVAYGKYSCNFCHKKFTIEWFLKHHIKIFHGGIEIYHMCDLCKKKFYNEGDLQNHRLKDHDIRKYSLKCNRCVESYENISQLREHLVKNHGGTWEADAAVANLMEIDKSRLKEKRGNRKECVVCNKVFFNSKTYNNHMNFHKSDKFPCNICGLDQDSLIQFKQHVLMHNKDFKCDKCDKSFGTSSKLQEHGKIHEARKSYTCEICGQRYHRHQLCNHYSWHSLTSNPSKKYHCNICSGSYQTNSLLTSHMQNVHSKNRKTFKCEECEKKFSVKLFLTKHLEDVHKKELPIQCNHCDRKFIDQKSAAAHSRIHTASEGRKLRGLNKEVYKQKIERPRKISTQSKSNAKVDMMACFSITRLGFVCPVCGRISGWKSHFIRHLRTHSMVGYTTPGSETTLPATIKCSYCTQMFPRRDLLLRHIRRRHAVKSSQHVSINPCNFCGREFQTKKLLDKHVNRHLIIIKTSRENGGSQHDLNYFYSEERKLLECSLCVNNFSTGQNDYFIAHHRNFHKSKIIHDLDAQKRKNSELDRHVQCSQCPKRFWDKTLVKQHERIAHEDCKLERKYECPTCHKVMKRDSVRFHKNKKCSFLQRSFKETPTEEINRCKEKDN